jgi:hypothetical protein
MTVATARYDRPFLPLPGDQDEVRRLHREGSLVRILGEVHGPADLQLTAAVRAGAVRLLLPAPLLDAGAVIGFGTAAWVHAGWAAWADPADPIDLVLPPHLRQRPPQHGPRLRQMRLTERHVQRIGGTPVTTAARTLADLARDLPPCRAGAAMTALHLATEVTPADVLTCLDQMPGARGCVHARLVVASWLADPPIDPAADQSSVRLPVIR